jgi:Xaa-Pro aminopeptidase
MIYVERDGERHVFASSLETPRLEELGGLEVHAYAELGVDELVRSGASLSELARELPLRACRAVGAEELSAPRSFPLHVADHLRANGLRLSADGDVFDARRRVKNAAELAGIGRAQRSAERAMSAIARILRSGSPTSSEALRAEAVRIFTEDGMAAPELVIVSHGPQAAIGHEPGSGPIGQGEAVIVDLFPMDLESGCFADMTRTFCVGEAPDELAAMQEACRAALERARESVRAGVDGSALHRAVCELFEERGYRTDLSKRDGEVLEDGFVHALGHGVGLEVHERPGLGRIGDALVAGDVIAVEPGLYRRGFGGCRLEDLLLVTDDGCETLTDFPYDL